MKAKIKEILVIVLLIISVISLNLEMNKNLTLLNSILGNNVLIIVELILIVYILKRIMKNKNKRLIIFV